MERAPLVQTHFGDIACNLAFFLSAKHAEHPRTWPLCTTSTRKASYALMAEATGIQAIGVQAKVIQAVSVEAMGIQAIGV